MSALTAPLSTPTAPERLLLALSRILADHAHARMRARAARIEENSPSVRPSAASIRPAISSSCSAAPTPSRPGGGRCAAT